MTSVSLLTLADFVALALLVAMALVVLLWPQPEHRPPAARPALTLTDDPALPFQQQNVTYVGSGPSADALLFLDLPPAPAEFRIAQPADLPLLAEAPPPSPTDDLNPHMLPFRRLSSVRPAPDRALFYLILALLVFIPLLLRFL